MIFKRKFSTKSFKFKIFINFLTTAFLIIIIMNVIIFQYFDIYMKNQINTMSRTKLENISTVYYSKMEQYHRIAELIFKTPKYSTSFYSSEKKSILEEIDMSNNLRPILSTNVAINSIFLFNKEKIKYELDTQYIDKINKNYILSEVLKSKTDRYPLMIELKNGIKKLVIFQTDRETLFGRSQTGVVLILDPKTLQNNILADYDNQPDEIYLIDNQRGDIMLSQNNKHILEQKDLKEILSSEKSYYSLNSKINSDLCIITYVKNIKEDYSIVSVIDYQSSIKELTRIRNIMIFFSAGVVLAAFLISYFLANRIYKPINNILSNIQTAFKRADQEEEHYDELKRASLAIDQAANKINLLESKYNDSEIIDYLRNSSDSSAPVPGRFKLLKDRLGLNFRYRTVLLELENYSNAGILNKVEAPVDNSSHLNFAQFINVICNGIFDRNDSQITFVSYNIEFCQAILILCEAHSGQNLDDIEKIGLYSKEIMDRLSIQHNVSVSLSISGLSEDIESIRKYYTQAQRLIKYKLFMGSNSIFINDTFTPEQLDESKAGEVSREILNLVKGGEVQQVANLYIDNILKVIKNVEYRQCLKYLSNLLADAENLSHNFSEESNEYRGSYLDIYLKIESCNGRCELTTLLQNMLNNACLELKIARSKTVQINIIESLEYINEHVGDRNLSVELLAEKFHISPSYFSKLFNNYTKKTFPDYVNCLRLQKAADLLVDNNNLDINEVSARVGFNSSSYFAAAFKKKYGVSPSKFRINHWLNS